MSESAVTDQTAATEQTTAEAPEEPKAPDFEAMGLKEYRQLKEQGESGEEPAKGEEAAKPAEKAARAEAEDEVDPELQKDIDEIEAPTAEESPQERAARTKRHRQAAFKARLTRQGKAREKAEKEAKELRAEVARLRQQLEPPPDDPARPTQAAKPGDDDPEPKPKDFDSDYEWTRALSSWNVRKERREAEAHAREKQSKRAATEREEAAKRQLQEGVETLKKRIDTFSKTHPDFGEKTADAEFPMIAHRYAMDSDEGAEVLYHLATHPDVNDRISGLADSAPHLAMAELGKLEATLVAARNAPPPKSTAPPPASRTVTGGGETESPEPDFSEMSLKQYKALKKRRAEASA